MRAFKACYIGELKKLSIRKKYTVYTIISELLCIMFALISAIMGKTAGSTFSVSIPLAVMSVFAQVIMPLVAAMAVCDLFATEFQDLSIKAQLMRPVSRFKIYTAKLCAVFSVCVIIFMCIFAVSVVADFIFTGNRGGVLYAFGAYLLNLIAMIPVILMAALINQFTKGSTSAMFLCIIIYVLLKIAGIFAPILDSLVFTGYLEWHKLWMGTPLPFGVLVSKFILILGYSITFFSGGYFMFLKREF
ncbi:MAG: ABC transporter permease [Clostridia bacterium]|nr:ABC transporter permease [Clostridia bacterium]